MMTCVLRIPARSITTNTYTPIFNEYTLDRAPDLYPLTTPPFNKSSGLGDLRKLPNELIDCILEHMDLASLMNFRLINDQTSASVEELSVFKTLCKFAPQTIRGIMSINTGQWTTCPELLATLCNAYCEECGDFGGYIYVLGPAQRVCFYCFTTSERFCPISPCEANERYELPIECLTEEIPKMRSIPGPYAEEHYIADPTSTSPHNDTRPIPCHDNLTLLDRSAIRKAAFDHSADEEFFLERERRARMTWRSHSRNCRRVVLCEDHKVHNVKRWMAIIKVPHFLRQERKMEEGFCCRACKNLAGKEGYWRRKFNAETWDEHLIEYGELREGKHVVPEEEEEEDGEGDDQGEDGDDEAEEEDNGGLALDLDDLAIGSSL